MAPIILLLFICFYVTSTFGFFNQIIRRQPLIRNHFATDPSQMKESLMTVDEIKAELDLRGVDYSDCLSRTEIIERLIETRASGKAKPELLDKLNNEENPVDIRGIDDSVLEDAKAADGSLPGGLPPQLLKALAGDPEVMTLLRDPKLQDMMKAVMTEGSSAMRRYMSDPGN
jgi:hypothetical protein